MAISSLLRDAFITSVNFQNQVNGIVSKQALHMADSWTYIDAGTRNMLAQAARTPQSYGFTGVIVNDNNWSLTYDAWANDPPGANGVIETFVNTHWLLLTGIVEPVPPEPEPEP